MGGARRLEIPHNAHARGASRNFNQGRIDMGDLALRQDLVPARRVNIYVTRDVDLDLNKMFDITKKVLGKLGCDGCHSGRILDFHIIEDFVVNQKGDVVPLPGPSGF